jgi:transposase
MRLSCDPGFPNLGFCTATGVENAVRRSSATSSCVVAREVQAMTRDEGNTMTIPPDLEAQILRYHHVEKWRAGTIARQLRVHRGTVMRVLAQAGLSGNGAPLRRSQVEPYLPFIRETLEKFPTLTASRLFDMVRERGYRGGPDYFRHLIARHRPRPPAEAYLRLRSLPGEQAQVDWGHFGHLTIGRARRPLMAFVMVLSWSRRISLSFFLDARMENFLRGHVAAFEAFKGCTRVLLYDNLKSAVLERAGDAIRFHPTLFAFAAHYRYEPRPVAVARGNEKGRVERAIRYVRDSFFAARTFTDLDDLNAQASAWCSGIAADRPCPEQKTQSVREAFAEEVPRLLPLPDNPYPLVERVAVKVGKTPYVRFDLNDYSVPHTAVQRTLTVLAEPHEVRIVDGLEILARHPRSYDKGAQIEDAAHINALVADKHAARRHRGTDRLMQAAPASEDLLIGAAQRGDNLGTITAALLRLLERYGAAELQAAIGEALARGVPHPNAVRLALEHRREQRQAPPPVAVDLPADIKARDAHVTPHRLEAYDQLKEPADE